MMTMNRDQFAVCADFVKEHISAQDVGRALGLELRHGRCKCPVHGGHDYNCVLYAGNRGFYCHVCKSGGDVIRLVQSSMQGMPFPEAIRWFNDTFHLGINIDSPVDERRLKQAKNRLKCKAEKRRDQERFRAMMFDMYLNAMDALSRMEEERDRNRPERYGDGWNGAFAGAVSAIRETERYADWFLDQYRMVKV